MNVLLVHNRYRIPSGEETIFEATNHVLLEKGHQVSVFERRSDTLSGISGKIRAFYEGIYSFATKKAILKIIDSKRPDVVHVHNFYPLISPSLLVACQQRNVPVVMTCQNYRLICPSAFRLRKGQICELCANGREYWCVLKNCRSNVLESIAFTLRNVVARKKRYFLDNVSCYVPPTEYVKNKLANAGFYECRINVVPNMVSVPNSGVDSSKGEYIAYSGRVSPEKGIETLLLSAYQTGLPIRLAGNYSAMKEIVKTAPKNVHFLGHLNQEQLAEFYRKARFLVVPSKWEEPFGLVVIDAMSHGLPIIASKIGGLAEIVEEGVTGLYIEPGNYEDLSNKMKLLWENMRMCREMGIEGRNKVIREYSLEMYYKRLIEIYRKVTQK